jgi:hypothetical protein
MNLFIVFRGIFRGFSLKRGAAKLRWAGGGVQRPVLCCNVLKKDGCAQRYQKPLVHYTVLVLLS